MLQRSTLYLNFTMNMMINLPSNNQNICQDFIKNVYFRRQCYFSKRKIYERQLIKKTYILAHKMMWSSFNFITCIWIYCMLNTGNSYLQKDGKIWWKNKLYADTISIISSCTLFRVIAKFKVEMVFSNQSLRRIF